MVWYLPLKLSVTEDSQTAKTGLTIKIFLWNWHTYNTTSPHDELPLNRRKENNFFKGIHIFKKNALSTHLYVFLYRYFLRLYFWGDNSVGVINSMIYRLLTIPLSAKNYAKELHTIYSIDLYNGCTLSLFPVYLHVFPWILLIIAS